MPGTPLHLLLVAVLVSTHGDTLGDTTHCNATVDHDLGQGDVTTVLTATKNSTEHTKVGYVKPKEGFEGVSVEVRGNKSEEAWFPADEMCLPANGSWWKLKVRVLLNTEQNKLYFILFCGKCHWLCFISEIHITSMEGILVKAHGPSSWNNTLINSITALRYDHPPLSMDACKKPPIRSSELLGSVMIWAAGVVGQVVIIVVVVVVAVRLRHRCRSPPQDTITEPASPAVHESLNSLNEPPTILLGYDFY